MHVAQQLPNVLHASSRRMWALNQGLEHIQELKQQLSVQTAQLRLEVCMQRIDPTQLC